MSGMSALEAGAELEPQEYDVRREDLVAYANASGDHNPIHQDEAIARLVGLPGVIAHGMYTMALAARAVATWTEDAEVVDLGCKFTAPVVVPAEGAATVRITGVVKGIADGCATIALEVTCAGDKVLGAPKAVVRV
jgi:acyl dehydratase